MKKSKQRLTLNKRTVARLNQVDMESINGGDIIVITTPGVWSLQNEFTCNEYTCGNQYDGPCMGQWEFSVVMGCND